MGKYVRKGLRSRTGIRAPRRCSPVQQPLETRAVSVTSSSRVSPADSRLAQAGEASVARVFLTGVGVVSSIGLGKAAFFEGLEAGKSGISPVGSFDASNLGRSL